MTVTIVGNAIPDNTGSSGAKILTESSNGSRLTLGREKFKKSTLPGIKDVFTLDS